MTVLMAQILHKYHKLEELRDVPRAFTGISTGKTKNWRQFVVTPQQNPDKNGKTLAKTLW